MTVFLIVLLLYALVFPLLLLRLPYVKYKKKSHAILVGLILAVLVSLLVGLQKVTEVLIWFFSLFIPFFGPLILAPIANFCVSVILMSLALNFADKKVEGFEIDGLDNLFTMALILSLTATLIRFVCGFVSA